jgi:hypothetical protein
MTPTEPLEQDLAATFRRRETDVTPSLQLPPSVRRRVRARQAGRVTAVGAAAVLVAAGSLAAIRAVGSTQGAPADDGPAPSYAPPTADAPAAAPYAIAAQGRVAGVRWVLRASGAPAEAAVRTRLHLETVPGSFAQGEVTGELDHLGAPLRASDGVEVKARHVSLPHPLWLLWGFWTEGVDHVTVSLEGCHPVTLTTDDVTDIGPSGVRMPVWHLATTCGAPTALEATTIFGANLGTRTVGQLPVRRI